MPNKMFFRMLLAVTLLAAAGMGCRLVNNIKEGVQLVGTGRAVATDFGSISTELIPPGIQETAQALITDVDTSGILETAQAAITEQAPVLGGTVQAFSTEIYTSPEQAPPDIPIMEGEKSAFVGTAEAVSYFLNADLKDAVNFYRTEMPKNGWQEDTSDNVSSDNLVELKFTKGGRTASVVVTQVPFVGQTTIVITITGE